MSQNIKDTEVLISNKMQIDNPEVVLQAIQDPNMKKIIRYRQKTEGDREV